MIRRSNLNKFDKGLFLSRWSQLWTRSIKPWPSRCQPYLLFVNDILGK